MTFDPTSETIPQNPAVRRVWICARLRLRNTSLRRLAKQEDVSQQAMSHALVGASSHLQPVIAAACGVPVQALFPEFYDEHGNRLGWTREKQRSTQPPSRNVEEEQAA